MSKSKTPEDQLLLDIAEYVHGYALVKPKGHKGDSALVSYWNEAIDAVCNQILDPNDNEVLLKAIARYKIRVRES